MKADADRAERIGSRLVLYKDSLAKTQGQVLDAAKLRTILDDTSHNALTAEQELVMAWRFYTQEREQQIAWGVFHFCSSPAEIDAARRFSRAREIIFDPANVKGVACIESKIAGAIEQDVLIDAIKWQAVEAQDVELKMRFRVMYEYAPSAIAIDLDTLDPKREEFAERNLQSCKIKAEYKFRKHYGDRIADAIRLMINEHRDFWAQRPTEPYDDSELTHILAFAFAGPNYGLGELFKAWDSYLEWRIMALDLKLGAPFDKCTDEEKASAKEERRKLPIEWPHSHRNAREIVEAHIKAIICEDIVADIDKWERHRREAEDAKKRYQEHRLIRIHKYRNDFISKVRIMFGEQVLKLISDADIDRYSLGIVDRQESGEELWYSILKNYDFDQNTNSCLYFIRQGDAIKIGITDNLNQRFAQIKTSAALTCKIENVVYTHHGRALERKVHQALARYNNHLEWFILPSSIEKRLFAAKSGRDIENALTEITNNSNDVPKTTPDPPTLPRQQGLF